MSKNSRTSNIDDRIIEIKSKFEAEFRRFSVRYMDSNHYVDFNQIVENLHSLRGQDFIITYTDIHGDLLPINNDDNYAKALASAKPLLRLNVQRKGTDAELNGYGTLPVKRRNPISKLMNNEAAPKPKIQIGLPEDFRRVSAIIDVDIVPETLRRVKLMKNGSDKPLGFYIRDGTSVRVTPGGLEKVPGIFISRLVPGGLAESTGLLAVNDEVIEVNGIEVCGKTLDQVTDMMVANSSNLIITVKPVNQRMTLAPQRGSMGRHSQMSNNSLQSQKSSRSYDSDTVNLVEQDEEDEVEEHLHSHDKSDKMEKNSAVLTL